MEIYFDKQNLRILTAIYRSGERGITWRQLQKRFGDRADDYFLMNLSSAGYTVTQDQNGNWIDYPDSRPLQTDPGFRSFVTDRGRAYLEDRVYSFRRWLIPTLISISALIVSVMSLAFALLRG